MSTGRKKIKLPTGAPTPRNINSCHQLLSRVDTELRIELQKIVEHLDQPSPRHKERFEMAFGNLTVALSWLGLARTNVQ